MSLRASGLVERMIFRREEVEAFDRYPFNIPAVHGLRELALDPKVTFFVGENGSGKSTVLEALALAAGFNAEGGTKNFNFATRASHSVLHEHVHLSRSGRKIQTGFFFRAESFYNVASEIDRLGDDLHASYGGKSLHDQSHGESFLSLITNRFGDGGLYLLDEPESALSPSRQLSLLSVMNDLVRKGSQFVVATHSPIVLAYPGATIYRFDEDGITAQDYEDTEPFSLTQDFLNHRERYLRHLLEG